MASGGIRHRTLILKGVDMKVEKVTFGIIFGSIFGGIGALFTIIGIIMTVNLEALIASPNSSGDVTILPIIFTGLGLLFLIIGVPFILHDIKVSKNKKRIIAEGYFIYAKVVEIRPNYAVRINGIHPYIVECQYNDPYSGAIHVFRSGNIMHFPENLIDTEVRVYVDRNNYGIYHVDLDGATGNVIVH